MHFTAGQLNRLATLFLNIAQGLFVTAFAISYFSNNAELIDAFRTFSIGIFFTFLSLYSEKHKEVIQKNE